MKRDDKDGLFEGLAPPAPPGDLRERVLVAARAELGSTPTADVWTRIWESRLLRAAWAAGVVALLVAHAAVTPREPSPRLATTEQPRDEAIADLLQPTRIEASAFPSLGRTGEDSYVLAELIDGDHGP